MSFTQTVTPLSSVGNPDADMAIECVLTDNNPENQGHLVWIFHDRPFLKVLSWIEYDLKTSRIDFVMEDGDVRNFGIYIDAAFKPYMQNSYVLPVILKEGDEPIDGTTYPLIVHSA